MSKITIDRELLEQALEALIAYEVKVDSEWGMGRSIEQIDAAGDTPSEISALREALVQPQPVQDDAAYKEAVSLATALFKKHFAHEEHYASGQVVWSPCDTAAGVISQIDNMVSGLVQPQPVQQDRVAELEAANAELLAVLGDIWYALEKARIWGGMEWKYNPLNPVHYLPARDKARAAIAKHGGAA